MNSTTQQPKHRSLQLKLAVAGAILVVVLVAIYFRLSSDIDDGREVNDSGGVEKPLERARNILQKDADLASCRSALQQVNAHLTEPDAKQPPTLSASQTAALRRQLELDEGELKELNIQRFTRLDAHHLELCLLLRDAVRALELRSRSGRAAPQVEAAAALGWVVRQVRPRAGEEQEPQPQLVLRRGFGSPLARALLFIGLLEQLGHDGCLLALPGGPNAAPRYWACGVLGEKGQIYLFDPRLGIPLPGPGGKGIATLAQAQGKDSPLRQLDFGKDSHYDVTPEQAAASEVHLVPSLSALAPRMELLQKDLLLPAVRVRLAADPLAVGRFAQALKDTGHKQTEVKLAPGVARIQRRFLPESEGGIDTRDEQKRVLFQLALPYMEHLHRALPPKIRPKDVLDLQVAPLNQVYKEFVERFTDFWMAPGQPRDLVLRGQYVEAQRSLGLTQERATVIQERYRETFKSNDAPGPKAVEQWYDEANRAAASDNQEALAEVWRRYAGPMTVLMGGSAADQRLAELAYLQGLCQLEQAERLQFRLEHFPKDVTDKEINQAQSLWRETSKLWEDYLGTHGASPPAKRFQARAQEKLADVIALRASRRPAERLTLEENARQGWDRAAILWGDLARETTDLQALAYHYQANRLKEKTTGKD